MKAAVATDPETCADSETYSMVNAICDKSLSSANISNKKKLRNKGQAKFSSHRRPTKKTKGSALISRSNQSDHNTHIKCKSKNDFFER